MNPKPDAVLVAEALSGQREAFTTLVHKHQDHAYGVAVCLLSDFDLAQDVVQESLLCAYQDLGKLRDPERFGVWLCGIVRYTAYAILRERERLRLMAEELRIAADARMPLPDEMIIAAEQRQLVRQAIKRLDRKQREVVGLHYFGSRPYRNIAELLEVSETTVKGRLQHARATLRKKLDTDVVDVPSILKGTHRGPAAGNGNGAEKEEAGWMTRGAHRHPKAGNNNPADGPTDSWIWRSSGAAEAITRDEAKDGMADTIYEPGRLSQAGRLLPPGATMPLVWKAFASKRRMEDFESGGECASPASYPLAA